jgi:nickel-dependent lactate racemase
VGESKLGDPVYINKLVMDADLCIAISEIASVPTAGYTGGSKMISVGCAGAQTIYHTHSLSIYYHPTSRCGKYVGNVFREHLDAILQKAESESKSGKFFLVNIIPNSRDMMVGVCAGDFIKSYLKACTIADQQWKVPIPREADIFIAAAGYPHDRSPYHISTSLSMLVLFPKPVFREGGVVIFPAPCDEAPKEGTTEYEFIKVMRDSFSIEDIYEKMRECEEKRIPTPVGLMRAYGTSLVVDRASEIFVVDPKIPGLIRDMWHTPVRGINEALRRAFNVVGSSASVVIAPSGIKIGGFVVCVS